MTARFAIETERRTQAVGITNRVEAALPATDGTATVFVRRTTAGVAVNEAGTCTPDCRDVLSMLTVRQPEVFQKVVGLDFYQILRRATRDEITEHRECAPSTIAEHLW